MNDHTERARAEGGFTLIELVIAITLLGIVILPLTMSMVTGLRTTVDAQARLSAARSPLFTSAFFARDAQAAARDGIINPNSLGTPACGTGANVVSFKWATTAPTPAGAHTYTVSYSLQGSGAKQTMTRSACTDSTTPHTTATLAPVLGAAPGATVTCSPACTGPPYPRTITMTVTKPKGGSFTLQATRRTA